MIVVLELVRARFSFTTRAALAVALLSTTVLLPIERPLRITAIAAVFFLVGSLLAEVPQPDRLPIWPVLLGVSALMFIEDDLGLVTACIVVPYTVVAIGSRTSVVARVVRGAGDPSYGMYLWAFPIQ